MNYYSPHALEPGTVIGGFELVRMLGEGGFGITYEAVSPVTRRKYAVKEFFPRGIASRESATRLACAEADRAVMHWALQRFESTTADLCQLRHPNIMEVVHYIKENETGYMIMEYVEGNTFEAWLNERGIPPSPRELRPLIEPLLDALEYVHHQGVIHRDIAPDNIMIRPDGRPVVIDFGAMKIPEKSKKQTQTFCITKQHYAAPEQGDDAMAPAPTLDIYSLAAVLYRAFASEPPHDAFLRKSGLVFRGVDPYTPLAQAAPALPQQIVEVIDSALSFHAADRPQTVAELRDRLIWDAPPVAPRPAAWPQPPIPHSAPDETPYDETPYKAFDDTRDEVPDRWSNVALDEGADDMPDAPSRLSDNVYPATPGLEHTRPRLRVGRLLFLLVAGVALAGLLWLAIVAPRTDVKLLAVGAAVILVIASWRRRPRVARATSAGQSPVALCLRFLATIALLVGVLIAISANIGGWTLLAIPGAILGVILVWLL